MDANHQLANSLAGERSKPKLDGPHVDVLKEFSRLSETGLWLFAE